MASKEVFKQPVITEVPTIETPPEGTCSQEDFDHLRSKGFIVTIASHSAVNFYKHSNEHRNTCLNIRYENGKWSAAVFRSWDTKNNDYDASFSPKYKTLKELLDKTKEDFTARAQLLESVK